MGEMQARPLKGVFVPGHWALQQALDGVAIYTDSQGRQVEVHTLRGEASTVPSASLETRLQGGSNIVRLVDVLLHEDGCGCEGFDAMQLVFERVPSRLSDHDLVQAQEGALILEEALFGFKEVLDLFKRHFLVEDSMIFINCQQEVKVWMHPSLMAFTPLAQCRSLTAWEKEHEMVESILTAVQRHCPGRQYSAALLARLEALALPLTFPAVYAAVAQHNRP
jgi:hypothetical protein